MTSDAGSGLLPLDGLSGSRIALSVSESTDLARLGLSESHFRMALGEIARSVLVAGGKILYGGNLDPNGYSAFLNQELHRYSRRDRPLRICLAWPQHTGMTLSNLRSFKDELGLFGELICLSADGKEIDGLTDRDESATQVFGSAASLTALREYTTACADARVLIGGKSEGYSGVLPGVLEEALIAAEAGQPCYLAGGFSGMTLEIIRAVNGPWAEWLPKTLNIDRATAAALDRLTAIGSNALMGENGLTEAENARLAATYRPSEIAALISLGLGRRLSRAGRKLPRR